MSRPRATRAIIWPWAHLRQQARSRRACPGSPSKRSRQLGALRRLGVVAEIAGHAGADGECERGVRLGGADEHVVEHSPVIEQLLSETIAVRTGAGSMARTLWLAVAS
jgi:hypothetical protein